MEILLIVSGLYASAAGGLFAIAPIKKKELTDNQKRIAGFTLAAGFVLQSLGVLL